MKELAALLLIINVSSLPQFFEVLGIDTVNTLRNVFQAQAAYNISAEISVWDLIDCKDPCSYSYYTFATRVAIDDNEELDLFMQGFYN